MKKLIFPVILLAIGVLWQACESKSRYVDPNTGTALNLKEDPKTGLMVDEETGKPVKIYVDTRTKDTIYGRTGKVINGSIRRNELSDGKYTYVYIDDDNDSRNNSDDDDATKVKTTEDETKIKSGDYKKEVEKDGDITIKDGNTKIKIDGETGKRKVKKDD